jgi:hypothetical protein
MLRTEHDDDLLRTPAHEVRVLSRGDLCAALGLW